MPISFFQELLPAFALQDDLVGIAIGREGTSIHTGLAYQIEGREPQIIHFGDHCDMRNESIKNRDWYRFSPLKLEFPEIILVQYWIDIILERQKTLKALNPSFGPNYIDYTYGINFVGAKFDKNDQAALILSTGSTGLTCATFVLTILGSANILIIDQPTWMIRNIDNPIDRAAQEKTIKMMIATHRSKEDIQKNIDAFPSIRYRPEEITVAASHKLYPAPLSYCEWLGSDIIKTLRKR